RTAAEHDRAGYPRRRLPSLTPLQPGLERCLVGSEGHVVGGLLLGGDAAGRLEAFHHRGEIDVGPGHALEPAAVSAAPARGRGGGGGGWRGSGAIWRPGRAAPTSVRGGALGPPISASGTAASLAPASTATPRNSSPSAARPRTTALRSPTPPVNTRASRPPMAAAMAAMDARSRGRDTSRANAASGSPASAPSTTPFTSPRPPRRSSPGPRLSRSR